MSHSFTKQQNNKRKQTKTNTHAHEQKNKPTKPYRTSARKKIVQLKFKQQEKTTQIKKRLGDCECTVICALESIDGLFRVLTRHSPMLE